MEGSMTTVRMKNAAGLIYQVKASGMPLKSLNANIALDRIRLKGMKSTKRPTFRLLFQHRK